MSALAMYFKWSSYISCSENGESGAQVASDLFTLQHFLPVTWHGHMVDACLAARLSPRMDPPRASHSFQFYFNECNGVQHVVSGRYCALYYVSKTHQQACHKHNECMAVLQLQIYFC